MGAPVGNFNALKHGKRSPRIGAERRAASKARQEDERKRFDAWAATIPKTDHAGICAALERERLELEAEERMHGHH